MDNQNQRPFTTEPLHESKTQRAQRKAKPRLRQRAEALAVKLAQTYEELSRLLERNPAMKRQMTEGDAKEDKIYQRLKQRLKMADMAPRCQWVKQDGTSVPVSADEAAHLLFCPQADGGSQGADADDSGGGRRQRDPGGADANTESAD